MWNNWAQRQTADEGLPRPGGSWTCLPQRGGLPSLFLRALQAPAFQETPCPPPPSPSTSAPTFPHQGELRFKTSYPPSPDLGKEAYSLGTHEWAHPLLPSSHQEPGQQGGPTVAGVSMADRTDHGKLKRGFLWGCLPRTGLLEGTVVRSHRRWCLMVAIKCPLN